MAEKEERIYIRGYGENNPCDTCEDTSGEECDFCMENYEWNASIPRAEAIDKMAKAICKISCACKYYACGNCTEFLEHYTPDLAEAALNALLDGGNDENKEREISRPKVK